MSCQIIENVVIITSVIDCPKSRSFYTREERLEQTKKTIDTVRFKIPNCFILLIDITQFTEEEHNYFNSSCNYVVNCANNNEALYNVRIHDNKSLGEWYYLLESLKIVQHVCEIYPTIQNVYKISGRYFLDDNFDYSFYNNDKCIVQLVDPKLWAYACASCLFKVPIDEIENLYNQLYHNREKFMQGLCMEYFMYGYIMSLDTSRYIHIDRLGISGMVCAGEKYLISSS
jgi:hypothetical protein